VRTALAVIDRDGVAGLSMRKLGAEMGVEAMAIYHHLPNKAALFDGVVEHLWSEVKFAPPTAGLEWTEQLAVFMRSFRDILWRHPRAVPIVGTRPAVTPGMLALLERALELLTTAGLDAGEALDLINCMASFTVGHVLAEVGEPVGAPGVPPEQVYASLTAESHPHLVGAIAAGYDYRPNEQFERGLRALIAGWAPASTPREGTGSDHI